MILVWFSSVISLTFSDNEATFSLLSVKLFILLFISLIFILAVSIPKPILAVTTNAALGPVANEIIDMILMFGKYGCLGMGTKSMIENMLAGANLKEATGAGLQYFIFYIVLNIYPKLFSMFKF